MSSEEDDLAIIALGLAVIAKNKKRGSKVGRKWCREWILKRQQYSHINIISELRSSPCDWYNYMRLDEERYLQLLAAVTPLIEKKDTVMRSAITPHERLTATLRFLATGRSYADMRFSTFISKQALSVIIPETCQAIYEALHKDFMKFPTTQAEWKSIAKEFENQWNFPHCLGAIDGKHVEIVPPAGSGSTFFNYKKRHSMVLMAIANARCEYIMVDFGTNGRVSDGGVLFNTHFYHQLINGHLDLPPAETVQTSNRLLPFVFITDDAFPLRTDMTKPYPYITQIYERHIFNYRIARARRCVESTFGIMANRFRVFHTKINLEVENIDKVVMACCVLHNFLMKTSTAYAPPDCMDRENSDGTVTQGLRAENMDNIAVRTLALSGSEDAKFVRDEFAQYFVNEGSVPWQNLYIPNYAQH